MGEWWKRLVAFIVALAISCIIFYSFFALIGIAFRVILSLFHIILIIIVALPFYVLIRKKLLK
ncbi:MAG: hypothetical protein ACP5RR_00345 [Candidatus Kapaibacteriota bacterium]|jgi:uncharacterized RDD family membrane protein YckC